MYGNMTSEEKRLNKEDLIAYKNFDNKQYSLIPGVSVNKKIMVRDGDASNKGSPALGQSSKFNDPRFDEKQDRMKQFGFSRDVRDIQAALGQSIGRAVSPDKNRSNVPLGQAEPLVGVRKQYPSTVNNSFDQEGFKQLVGNPNQGHIDQPEASLD